MYGFFTNVPTPHKVELLNVLFDKLNGELHVFFFGTGGKKRRGWESFLDKARFPYSFVKSIRLDTGISYDPGYLFFPRDLPEISKFDKIVVSGGISPVEIAIAYKALREGIPYHVWTGAVSLKGGFSLLKPARFLLRKWLYSNAESVIAANSLAEAHARRMGAKRTAIAYTSFDIHRFDYDKEHEGNFLNILFAGRLVGVKRLVDLIEAVRSLDNLKLTIMGDGPEKGRIVSSINRYNLHDKVVLKPSVSYEDIPRIYRSYNLFILPSDMEVHGFVVMEALMSSVPVIVTNEVGAKDFVIPEAIYPVGNIEELKRRIEWMRNPENRNRAVRYGKELIKSKATPEKWAEVFYRVFTDA